MYVSASGRTTGIMMEAGDDVSHHSSRLRWSRCASRYPSFQDTSCETCRLPDVTSSLSVPNVSVVANSCSSRASSARHDFPACHEVRRCHLQGLVRWRRVVKWDHHVPQVRRTHVEKVDRVGTIDLRMWYCFPNSTTSCKGHCQCQGRVAIPFSPAAPPFLRSSW